jgi:hypothetical protein
MAPKVLKRTIRGRRFERMLKTPKARHPSDDGEVLVSYFPGEAARILDLRGTDYRQLRRLFSTVVGEARIHAEKGDKQWIWSRYEFRDLVAVRVALGLARRTRSGRLSLKAVQEACNVLRNQFRLANPLTEIRLERQGDTILARVGGRVFDARTGQRLIDEVATHVTGYVENKCELDEQPGCLEQRDEQSRVLRAGFSRDSGVAAVTTTRGAK